MRKDRVKTLLDQIRTVNIWDVFKESFPEIDLSNVEFGGWKTNLISAKNILLDKAKIKIFICISLFQLLSNSAYTQLCNAKFKINTVAVNDITSTTALVEFNFTSKTDSPCSSDMNHPLYKEAGAVWSSDSNTQITLKNKTVLPYFQQPRFKFARINGLIPNTIYFVRPYIITPKDTFYGNAISFRTLNDNNTVTDVDGNIYSTVTIGKQVWMRENLRTIHYRNGDPIKYLDDNAAWTNSTGKGAYCYANNDSSLNNKISLGCIYNFYVTSDERNVCPIGWHIPTESEIKTLISFAGGEKAAGVKLVDRSFIPRWPEPEASNEMGLSLNHYYMRHYNNKGEFILLSNFWSITQDFNMTAKTFGGGTNQVGFGLNDQRSGCSIRCIKD
jgi:uncharacterized protein (TIGR02145 family)